VNAAVSPAIAAATGEARPLLAQVARNARWALAANAYYVACQAGVLLVVARQGSPELVGQLALALAVAAPVQLLASLQLRSAQATDVGGDYAFGEYLRVRGAGACAAIVVVAALARLLGLDERVTVAVGVMKAVESLSDVAYGRLQHDQRYDRLGISQALRGTLAIVVASAVLGAGGGLATAVLAIAAAWLLVCVGYDLAGLPRGAHRTTWVRLRALVRSSLPLGVAACAGSVAANVPRWLLWDAGTEAAVGYFAALSYVVVVGSLLASALGQAVCPLLAASHRAAPGRFVRMTLGLSALVAAASVLALAAAASRGGDLLAVLYGPDYAAYATVFTWLTLAGGLAAVTSFLNYALTATRRFGHVLAVQLAAGAGALLIGLVRVPAAGILGAAQATVAANLVALAVLAWLLIRATGAVDD
jgi:O-antigen/teichoic acid export membrane protein